MSEGWGGGRKGNRCPNEPGFSRRRALRKLREWGSGKLERWELRKVEMEAFELGGGGGVGKFGGGVLGSWR